MGKVRKSCYKYCLSLPFPILVEGFEIKDLPPMSPPNNYGQYMGSMSNHDKVIENVVDTLQGRAQIATNGANGMKVVEIIEAMYSKCKTKSNK